MRGLDTNVLVRYLTQDEPSQAKRVNALIADAVAKGERLRLDDVVLCELVWVLRGAYGLDKATVVATIEKVLDAGQFSFDDRDLLKHAAAAYRDGGGDFADYVIGLRNQCAGCTATETFDKALRKSGLFTQL